MGWPHTDASRAESGPGTPPTSAQLSVTPRRSASTPPLDELAERRHDRLALLFGTEGDGLTSGALVAADPRVSIPMDACVDSLNAAATSAVAFYLTLPRA
ncbi:TrmH family RNA methyltransferase [Streptomyces sp. NPDC058665]|uniref:TrmH family RNA methyltransferase n=1 Tax=Streptomyces sp. NPDC058665 TaxID=3346586 RepID=UPI00364AE547